MGCCGASTEHKYSSSISSLFWMLPHHNHHHHHGYGSVGTCFKCYSLSRSCVWSITRPYVIWFSYKVWLMLWGIKVTTYLLVGTWLNNLNTCIVHCVTSEKLNYELTDRPNPQLSYSANKHTYSTGNQPPCQRYKCIFLFFIILHCKT